jgi:hypothetical protein
MRLHARLAIAARAKLRLAAKEGGDQMEELCQFIRAAPRHDRGVRASSGDTSAWHACSGGEGSKPPRDSSGAEGLVVDRI